MSHQSSRTLSGLISLKSCDVRTVTRREPHASSESIGVSSTGFLNAMASQMSVRHKTHSAPAVQCARQHTLIIAVKSAGQNPNRDLKSEAAKTRFYRSASIQKSRRGLTAIDQENLRAVFANPDHWHELCNLLSPTDRPSHIQPGEWTVTYALCLRCNRQRICWLSAECCWQPVASEQSLCSGHRASWFQNCPRKRSPKIEAAVQKYAGTATIRRSSAREIGL